MCDLFIALNLAYSSLVIYIFIFLGEETYSSLIVQNTIEDSLTTGQSYS